MNARERVDGPWRAWGGLAFRALSRGRDRVDAGPTVSRPAVAGDRVPARVLASTDRRAAAVYEQEQVRLGRAGERGFAR